MGFTMQKKLKDALKGYGGYILVVVFICISLLYQGWGFILNYPSYSTVDYIKIEPCYNFKVRLPYQFPLSSVPASNQVRPITIWGWKDHKSICVSKPDQIYVLMHDRENLIFTDKEKSDSAASLLINMGVNESQAEPRSIYVYVPLRNNASEKILLNLEILGKTRASWLLSVQTPFIAGVFRILDLLLGTPLIAALTFVFAATKFVFDWQEKRKNELRDMEKQIEMLGNDKEAIVLQALDLHKQILAKNAPVYIQEKLVREFERHKGLNSPGGIWSSRLRDEIVRRCGSDDFQEWLEGIPEWVGFYSDEKSGENDKEFLISTLKQLRSLNQASGLTKELLSNLMRIFNMLGLASKKMIIEKLDALFRKSQKLESAVINLLYEEWYIKGGAGGRYLLRSLANTTIREKLEQWETRNFVAPNIINQRFYPWLNTSDVKYPKKNKMARMPERNPFGPVKAEDDQRLPIPEVNREYSGSEKENGLFWDDHPLWKASIIQPESALYLAGAGMGTTAFIWMGRRERRYAGLTPSFSVYVPLTGEASMEKIWNELEAGLAESLLISLSEDPYWFLGANHSTQEHVGRFLLDYHNDPTRLLLLLEELGLPVHEQMILADMLISVKSAPPYKRENYHRVLEDTITLMREAASCRVNDDKGFDCYFWVEIKNASTSGWLDLIDRTGISTIGRLKIFSKESKRDLNKEHRQFSKLVNWSNAELNELLSHRIKQTCKEAGWQRYFAGLDRDQLIADAKGIPQELINLGNIALQPMQRKGYK